MNTAQADSGAPPSPPPVVKRRGRKLGSIKAVRAALSWAWRELEADRLDIPKAKAFATLGYAIIAALQKSDVVERLAELEKVVASGGRAGVVRPLSRQASGLSGDA